jgi:accessory colonization factor AcfC
MFVTQLHQASARARALDVWREAADLVWRRWSIYLEAEAEARTFAFASYIAALDAEEAGAAEIAALAGRVAA